MDVPPEILVIYPQAAPEPGRVEEILAQREARCAVVYLRALAEGRRRLSFRIGPSHPPEFRLRDERTGRLVTTAAVRGVWVEGIDTGLEEPEWSGKIQEVPQYLRTIGHYETLSLLHSFLAEVPRRCTVFPQVFDGSRTGHRLAQIIAARNAGFAIPRTYMGQSPHAMVEWLRPETEERLHYHPLTAFRFEVRGRRFLTVERHVGAESRFALSHLTSPALFSARPSAARRCLVAVLPRDLFALEAELVDPGRDPDVTDLVYQHIQGNLRLTPFELPEGIRRSSLQLAQELGLRYGILDLLREPGDGGRCFFLALHPFARPLLFEEAGFPVYERLVETLLS